MSPLSPRPWHHWARWLGRVVLSALFAWAAIGKLGDPQAFATDIGNYQMVEGQWLGLLSVGLPAFELVLALTLWLPPLYRGSALLTGAMLWVFAGAMVQARMRGIDLDCGCFGAETRVAVGADTILRNIALGLIGLWVAFSGRPTGQLEKNPL